MQKKIPQRQCMGCRERKAKRELIRVVRGTDGTVGLDFTGKRNGLPEAQIRERVRKMYG